MKFVYFLVIFLTSTNLGHSFSFGENVTPPTLNSLLKKTPEFELCIEAIKTTNYYVDELSNKKHMLKCWSDFWSPFADYYKAHLFLTNELVDSNLHATFRGAGACLRAAKLRKDQQKIDSIIRHFRMSWEKILEIGSQGNSIQFGLLVMKIIPEFITATRTEINWNDPRNWFSESEIYQADAKYWNTKCAGFFGTKRNELMSDAEKDLNPINFSYERAGGVITITGDIGPGFSDEFNKQLNSHDYVRSIVLSSAGGTDIFEAIKAGRTIRKRQLFVSAVGNCESACTFVYAGGIARRVGNVELGSITYGRLGFHRLTVAGAAIPENSKIYDHVQSYFEEMNAEPSMVIKLMTTAPGIQMYYPSESELCDAKLLGFIDDGRAQYSKKNGCNRTRRFPNGPMYIAPN